MAVSDYAALFEQAGKQYGIDPKLLEAVASAESSGNPNAVGTPTKYGTAHGLMQIMPDTAKSLGIDPKDPKQAIPAAARLLAENFARYRDPNMAILAYHGGTDQANWGPKTQAYLSSVSDYFSGKKPMATNASEMSDDDLIAALTGSPKASSAPSNPSEMTDDDLIKALTAGAKDKSAKTSPQAAKQPADITADSIAKAAPQARASLGAGAVQGVRDVVSSLDAPAQWLQRHIPLPESVQTLGGLLPTADQAHQNNLVARDQFNQQYGNDPNAVAGRVGGNIVATLPAFGAAGRVAGSAADLAGAAIPEAAPALNVLTGAAPAATKIGKYAAGAIRGAAQGGLGAALLSSQSDQPVSDQIQTGAEFGGALGAAAPALVDAGRGVINAFSKPSINPLRAQLAEKAINEYGIPLRGSQFSESPFAKYLDSTVGKVPLSGLASNNEEQRAAFTQAVSKTFGEDTSSLSPKVMSDAKSRIGGVFNRVAANTNIAVDNDLINNLANIDQFSKEVGLDKGQVDAINNQLTKIQDIAAQNNGVIPGSAYQSLTEKNSSLMNMAEKGQGTVRDIARQIRNSLDDALERSASPDDLNDLINARHQYKNLMTVKDLAAKAGIEGEISPALLLGAVKKSYRDMAFGGGGDLGDLARIGQEFLKEPPSSGTGERIALYELLHGMGRTAVGGVVGGAAAMAPVDAGITLGGTLAAGRTIGSVLKSDWYRNRLLQSATAVPPVGQAGPNGLLNMLSDYGIPLSLIARNNLTNQPPALGVNQ